MSSYFKIFQDLPWYFIIFRDISRSFRSRKITGSPLSVRQDGGCARSSTLDLMAPVPGLPGLPIWRLAPYWAPTIFRPRMDSDLASQHIWRCVKNSDPHHQLQWRQPWAILGSPSGTLRDPHLTNEERLALKLATCIAPDADGFYMFLSGDQNHGSWTWQ